jgi:protein subunit release factor A
MSLARDEIKKNLKVLVQRPTQSGGQHCGSPVYGIKIESEELSIVIELKHFRSQHQNREAALELIDKLMDIINI